MYSFIDVMIDCLNYVPSVALKSAAFNPSWHLTAVGGSVSKPVSAAGQAKPEIAQHNKTKLYDTRQAH
jgi:hypothetical protein